MAVDARKYGVKFDGVTDDTVALQKAIDACPLPNYLNMPKQDWPARVLQLPAGRAKITAPMLLPSNFMLRGHGPSSTYLVSYHEGNAVQLRTGAEIQTTIRDLGFIMQNPLGNGIDLTQSVATSILGDANHQVDNVVAVGGQRALYCYGNTECRFTNILAYRQRPPGDNACIYLGGTDHMVERVTVAQPQWDGSSQGGAGIRASTSNTRFVNCKVFGGDATIAESMKPAFYLIGQRNSVTALEVQDYAGSLAIEDDQGNNLYSQLVVDSCQTGGIYTGGPVVISSALFVNRGGKFNMPYALNVGDGAGADINCRVLDVPKVFKQGQTGAGNFIRVNGAYV